MIILFRKDPRHHRPPLLRLRVMASVYSVSEKGETKLHGLAPQTVAKRTWSEALDGALRVLAEERKAGTSLSWSYLGGKFPGIRFRATGCLRALQLFVSFAAIPLAYFAFSFWVSMCDANNIVHLPEYVYQRLIDSWTIS